ncbi:MAG: HAMP domain-containing histidine kinase [Actinomycetota bacterium]|nr:HAMP domain-containing histidine kinase [Actinomycetota bacterium]
MRAVATRRRRRRRAARLRPRLVFTFAVVAALASVAVALSSYVLVRRAILNRATLAAVRETRANLEDVADQLSASTSRRHVEQLVARLESGGGFDVVAVEPDGSFETTSMSLSADSVPAALRRLVTEGRLASARATAGGQPYIVVGSRLLPHGRAFYFFFTLSDVIADLELLRNVLAAVGGTLVIVSGLVGAAAASGVLQPLRRALNAVRRLEAGLLETRLPVEGRDEFAELSRSFNLMAEALEQTVGELRGLEASHRRFVADVSHELRTPITALTTAADVLEANMDGLGGVGRRAARLLVLESRRLATLVEDLMEISRLDAGMAPMAWERVDVGVAVSGAVRARGWSDRVESQVGEDLTTYVDPRRLDTIVANLVGNALEHGEPPVRLTVTATAEEVRVEVADSGQGIPDEHLPHLFERFYKGDPSRPRSAGSGLGLAIARENARLHDGDILVTNRPGRGATFTLVLPRRQEAPTANGEAARADAYLRRSGVSGAGSSGGRPRHASEEPESDTLRLH